MFKNDKGSNPNRPDYKGDAMVNGCHVEISAWVKDGKKGKFLSLSIGPRRATLPAKKVDPQAPLDRDFDQDIPF